jgi:phosphate transport system permease protein
MTDMALAPTRTVDFASDAARARVRARYRAEARFKFYGLSAVGLTGLFVVLVLIDIIIKGLPAFTQHWIVLDVAYAASEIDPDGKRDPQTLRNGDYQAVVRNTLRAEFPNVTGRTERRALDGIVSSGAADRLRAEVIANPSLIGTTAKVPLLLSDDADLYYKSGTRIDRRPGRGVATVSGTTGEVTFTSSANDFSADIVIIKRAQSEKARVLRQEAARFGNFVRGLEAKKTSLEATLASASTDALRNQIAAVDQEAKDLTQRMNDLNQQATALQAKFDAAATDETLDESVPSVLVAMNGGLIKITQLTGTQSKGTVLLPLKSAAESPAGQWEVVTYVVPEGNRKVSDREVAWLEHFRATGAVKSTFNWAFFTSGDSREPELAGILGALVGSAITLLVTLVLCLPIGVAAAIYLEEFAPKNRLTEIIEININNLAAVPSIVFGLLGLAMFLNFFGLPRSAPLVGGLVLALLVLPTIIIASRAALKAVPPSIKEAALGVGASQQQAVFHHVLPLAMPGIMTGTIIGMAHALGETAPLLMIGMVAFIVEIPSGITTAATVLPVQIYLWSDLPEIAFQAKTAAAIMVLLVFLFVMNGAAIYLRRQFERRW